MPSVNEKFRVLLVTQFDRWGGTCTYGACRYIVNLHQILGKIKGVTSCMAFVGQARDVAKLYKPHIVVYEWSPEPIIPDALSCMILHGDTQLNHQMNRDKIENFADMLIVNSNRLEKKAKEYLKHIGIPHKVCYPPFIAPTVGKINPRYITLPSNLIRKGGNLFLDIAQHCVGKGDIPYKFLGITGTLNEKVPLPDGIGENWPLQKNFGKVIENTAIMIHASLFESFGYSWLEAAYCGVPVVGVASDGMKELGLKDWGILIKDPKDLEEWHASFVEIGNNHSHYSEKAKAYFANSPLTHSEPGVRDLVEWWETCISNLKPRHK